mmetsp:Transcript_41653/g.56581  ORF Transcript_41653/g.56581 Transcript_41653/m.56581 type:complete len:202 (-) Transcript_41653:46-651(-)
MDYITDKEVEMSSLHGSKVLISFFRQSACPACHLRLYQMKRNHAVLSKAGIRMVAVFANSSDMMGPFINKKWAPFPILTDPDSSVHNAFENYSVPACIASEMIGAMCGARCLAIPMIRASIKRGTGLYGACIGYCCCTGEDCTSQPTHMPADFLIDGEGYIVESHHGKHLADHMAWQKIFEFAGIPSTPPMGAPLVDEMER